MNIAIIGSFDFHLECIAFLLEIFRNNSDNIDIYLNKQSDRFKWIEYYSNIYDFNTIYNSFNSNIINKYDKVFKLSSNDTCLDHKKIISILHLNRKAQRQCKSEKFISLTPYINGNSIHYMFPIYKPIINNCSKNKIITMIGHYTDDNIDNDLLRFIDLNSNYTFNFIISGATGNKLKNIKNVNFHSGINTDIMINLLNDSKYVLSKKYIHYDRFSGQLGLAMSHEIPLLIDMTTKNNYKLPGIGFKKNYCDIKILDSISDEEYSIIKNEIKIFNYNMVENNKITFESLLK